MIEISEVLYQWQQGRSRSKIAESLEISCPPLDFFEIDIIYVSETHNRKEVIHMATWDVFKELDNLRREIDEAFRGAGYNRPFGPTFLSPVTTRRFPLVNFSEDEGHVYIEALVPGVDPKDVDLSVLRNTVTISGERKPFVGKEGQIIHRSELGSGKFSRTLELPVDIDPEKISAQCKDGIMQITLAKAEHAKPKKIEIKLS